MTALYPRAAAHEGPNGNDKIFEALEEKMRTGVIPTERVPFTEDIGGRSITRQFCANFGRNYEASMKMDTSSSEHTGPRLAN